MQILRQVCPAALLILGACSGSQPSACGGEGVVASNPWVRAAGEGRPMSAAYVELCNGGDTPERLIAVRYDGAEAAEIHITQMSEDGMASMAPAKDGVLLPPQEMTALAPGGAHIMLIGLTAPIEEGEEAALTLEFEHAEPVTIMFEAKSAAEAAAQSHH